MSKEMSKLEQIDYASAVRTRHIAKCPACQQFQPCSVLITIEWAQEIIQAT